MYEPAFNRIEKIKIVGSTFMAACGLISGRKGSQDYEGQIESFSKERLKTETCQSSRYRIRE